MPVDPELKQDILNRTHVIESSKECAQVVEHLQNRGEPIGLDMEGIHFQPLGLVQVRAWDKSIYLLRTYRNPDLLVQGQIKSLLENPNIIKVMHGSTMDCLAIHKAGVNMSGIFDTAIAHKVVQYQNHGISRFADSLSFNRICSENGLGSNPLKYFMTDVLWRDSSVYLQDILDEELVLYSACDVDPLLDLFHIYESQIDPDFLPMFQFMCENEMLRATDNDLYRSRRSMAVKSNQSNIFIQNIGSKWTKKRIYNYLGDIKGLKTVLFSETNHTAHILTEDRKSALFLLKTLLSRAQEQSDDFKVSLVIPPTPKEIHVNQLECYRDRPLVDCSNGTQDTEKLANLVDMIIQTGCPIAMDTSLKREENNNLLSLELFVGQSPTLKVSLTDETTQDGKLAELLASDRVVKIVSRFNVSSVHEVVRKCFRKSGLIPRNFFELTSGYRGVQMCRNAKSIFQCPDPTIKDLLADFGLSHQNKLEDFVLLYFHFKNILPDPILDFLHAKSVVDIDIGAKRNLVQAKATRTLLKNKEKRLIHVRSKNVFSSIHEFQTNLRELIQDELEGMAVIYCFTGRTALVEVKEESIITPVMSTLVKNHEDKWQLKKIDLYAYVKRKPSIPCDRTILSRMSTSFVEDLENLGFYSVFHNWQNDIGVKSLK